MIRHSILILLILSCLWIAIDEARNNTSCLQTSWTQLGSGAMLWICAGNIPPEPKYKFDLPNHSHFGYSGQTGKPNTFCRITIYYLDPWEVGPVDWWLEL